jgi:hypothetical protein
MLPAALCIDTCYGHVLGTLHSTLWSRPCLTILFMNHFSGLENSKTGNWDKCIPAYCTYAPRFFGICTPVCTYKPHMFLNSSFAYIPQMFISEHDCRLKSSNYDLLLRCFIKFFKESLAVNFMIRWWLYIFLFEKWLPVSGGDVRITRITIYPPTSPPPRLADLAAG